MSTTRSDVVENETKGKIVSIHCIECKRATRHRVAVSLDKAGSETDADDGWSVDWSERYQVIECQGCEAVSFRRISWFSEDQHFDEDGTTERIYPLRNKDAVSPRANHNVPTNLRRIYH